MLALPDEYASMSLVCILEQVLLMTKSRDIKIPTLSCPQHFGAWPCPPCTPIYPALKVPTWPFQSPNWQEFLRELNGAQHSSLPFQLCWGQTGSHRLIRWCRCPCHLPISGGWSSLVGSCQSASYFGSSVNILSILSHVVICSLDWFPYHLDTIPVTSWDFVLDPVSCIRKPANPTKLLF